MGLSVEDLLHYMTPEPPQRPLPSKARRNRRMAEILHEHFVLGASAEQIAQRRHVTPSTVRTALRQGMHLLRHSAARGTRVPAELLSRER